MNRASNLNWLPCCLALAASILSGCGTPLRKPPLLTPMPSQQFLLTPPPAATSPATAPAKANADCGKPNCT